MDARSFKQQLLDELYKPYRACIQCPLGFLDRTHVVFGEGNPDADLMLIGEGPGYDEDTQGRPFVGRSGQLLNKTLEHVGLKRTDIFITNIVKCRPPNNRVPTPLESSTCKKILLFKQIKIIRPTIICTLGSTALSGLIEQEVKITKQRGLIIKKDDMVIFPVYHPAYILRNPKEADTFISDFQTIKSLLSK